MSTDALAQLLDAATADVPPRHRGVPLAAIHGRIRRRRALIAAVAGASTVVVLLGGFAVARTVMAAPPALPPAGGSTQSPDPTALPWLSALVGRDDRTVTVFGGVDGCRVLAQPQAKLTAEDAAQVTVALYGQIAPAADCSTSSEAVPVVVTLPAALGTRQVLDAAGGSRPLYHERDLPQLPAGWTVIPHVGWGPTNSGWYTGYNGPKGTEVDLSAQPYAAPSASVPTVATVALGTRQGTITGGKNGLWRVAWQVGNVAYSLRYVPSEGGSFSLNQFKSLLATLQWS